MDGIVLVAFISETSAVKSGVKMTERAGRRGKEGEWDKVNCGITERQLQIGLHDGSSAGGQVVDIAEDPGGHEGGGLQQHQGESRDGRFDALDCADDHLRAGDGQCPADVQKQNRCVARDGSSDQHGSSGVRQLTGFILTAQIDDLTVQQSREP